MPLSNIPLSNIPLSNIPISSWFRRQKGKISHSLSLYFLTLSFCATWSHYSFGFGSIDSFENPIGLLSQIPFKYEGFSTNPAGSAYVTFGRTFIFEDTYPLELLWTLSSNTIITAAYFAIPYAYASIAGSVANKVPNYANLLRKSVSYLSYTMATTAVASNILILAPAIYQHTNAVISSEMSRRRCTRRHGVMPIYPTSPWVAKHLLMKVRFDKSAPATLIIDRIINRLSGLEDHSAPEELSEESSNELDSQEISHWKALDAAMDAAHIDKIEISIRNLSDGLALAVRSQSGGESTLNTLSLKYDAPWDLEVMTSFCQKYNTKPIRSVFHPEIISTLSRVITPERLYESTESDSLFVKEHFPEEQAIVKLAAKSEEHNTAVFNLEHGGQLMQSDQSSLLTPSVGFMMLTDHSLNGTQLITNTASPVFSQGLAVMSSRQITVPKYMVNAAMMLLKLVLDSLSLNQLRQLISTLAFAASTEPKISEVGINNGHDSAKKARLAYQSLQTFVRSNLFKSDMLAYSLVARKLYTANWWLLSLPGVTSNMMRIRRDEFRITSNPAPALIPAAEPLSETATSTNQPRSKVKPPVAPKPRSKVKPPVAPKQSSEVKPPLPPKQRSEVKPSLPPKQSSEVKPSLPPKQSSEVKPPLPPKQRSEVKPSLPPKQSSEVKPSLAPKQTIRQFPVVARIPKPRAGSQESQDASAKVETSPRLGGPRIRKIKSDLPPLAEALQAKALQTKAPQATFDIESLQGKALRAALMGKLKLLKQLIEDGSVDPNYKYGYGHTLLHNALYSKKKDIIKYLLGLSEVDLTQKNESDFSSFDMLIWHKAENIKPYMEEISLDRLQKALAHTFFHGVKGVIPTPVKSWEKVLLAAIERGVDFSEMRTSKGILFFHHAVTNNSVAIIKALELTEQGRKFIADNLNRADHLGHYPLGITAYFGLAEMWTKLDELGAIHQKSKAGRSLPHQTVHFCSHEELSETMKAARDQQY